MQDWRHAAAADALEMRAGEIAAYEEAFWTALADDLHTPKALAAAWGTARDPALRAAEKLQLLLRFDEVIGLDLARAGGDTLDDELLSLIARRQEARRMRDWATADALRAALLERGIRIKDRADGTDWERMH